LAEIKSTLDLVLEKTSHLTMSSKEKAQQRDAELQRKLRGFLQKYEDGLMTRDQVEKAWNELDGAGSLERHPMWILEIASRLDLDGDTGPLLDLLENGCGVSVGEVEAVVTDYRSALRAKGVEKTREMTADLAAAGIRGDAVIPNVSGDPDFNENIKALKSEHEKRLHRIFRQFTDG